MKTYADRDLRTNIVAYEYTDTSITVEFLDGMRYEYTAESAGQSIIDQLKSAADAGHGLNGLIMRVAKLKYARKWKA